MTNYGWTELNYVLEPVHEQIILEKLKQSIIMAAVIKQPFQYINNLL